MFSMVSPIFAAYDIRRHWTQAEGRIPKLGGNVFAKGGTNRSRVYPVVSK